MGLYEALSKAYMCICKCVCACANTHASAFERASTEREGGVDKSEDGLQAELRGALRLFGSSFLKDKKNPCGGFCVRFLLDCVFVIVLLRCVSF